MFIASEKQLRADMARGDFDELTAPIVRAIVKDSTLTTTEKLEKLNTIGRFYGVEYLGEFKRTGERVYYCNAGDSYAATFVAIGNRVMRCTSWGDMVEGGQIKESE